MPGIVSPGLINLRDERFLNASWLQADWWEIKTAFTAVTLTDGKREGGKANGAVGVLDAPGGGGGLHGLKEDV